MMTIEIAFFVLVQIYLKPFIEVKVPILKLNPRCGYLFLQYHLPCPYKNRHSDLLDFFSFSLLRGLCQLILELETDEVNLGHHN